MTPLARKLKVLCGEHRITPTALSRAIGGVSKSTMFNWFNGVNRPDLDSALRIARVFGVPLDYLADDAQDAPPSPEVTDSERLVVQAFRKSGLDVVDGVAALALAAEEARRARRVGEGDREVDGASTRRSEEGVDLSALTARAMQSPRPTKPRPKSRGGDARGGSRGEEPGGGKGSKAER